MSAISRMPAFAAWMLSPIPGASSTIVESASEAISTSACPTPTVSISTTSQPAASSTRSACGVDQDSPPRCPREAIERMNTPWSVACSCIRTRSPSSAPPENGEEGSTASTPTRAPRRRYADTSALADVDLPTPGEPVSPTIWARPVRGARVGVLAVDPSSPFSGGALLGDRVRMQEHATDRGVFIRSMASRGHLGGLSWSTPQALRVLDAAGCDVVLIETVGVGQAEVEIASLADSTIVLLAPGMGDSIQAAKAGILEIADIFVVNKADRDGADTTVRDLRYMASLGDKRDPERGH